MAAMSSAGVGALSNPHWCVISMLCNTTHIKTMFRIFHYLPASGDPVVCHYLFLLELSSAVGLNKPWHQSGGKKILQI